MELDKLGHGVVMMFVDNFLLDFFNFFSFRERFNFSFLYILYNNIEHFSINNTQL